MKRTITGEVPTHELSNQERLTLRRAYAIVDELAYIYRDVGRGDSIAECCLELKSLLAEPDDAPAEEDDK